jgi:hypothetical protein
VFYQHLDTNGDGTGTLNANVDGSSTPVEFYIEAADNDVLELHRIIIHIADNGSIQPHTYGALARSPGRGDHGQGKRRVGEGVLRR